jgi:hypothetical protein
VEAAACLTRTGGIVSRQKRDAAARLVRTMIEDGTLKPGGPAPSGAALARQAGCSIITGRAALRLLLADGTLVPGPSPTARLRVTQPAGTPALDADWLRSALSSTLASRRRAAELTQPELAAKIGMSPTAVGHAETGRVWQSRHFWQLADQALGDIGDLVRMHDRYTAALSAAPQDATPKPDGPVTGGALPVSITISAAGVVALWPDGTETVARPPAPATAEDGCTSPDPGICPPLSTPPPTMT